MIDKLDVRVSEFAPPGRILARPLAELKRHPVPLFRPSKYYQYVCDLREPFGIDAVVHLFLRFGRPNHKVEIIDAGQKTLQEMTEIVTSLFDVDPWSLKVMRTDLAADTEVASVPWFKDYSYVSRKQFSSRIAKSFEKELQFVAMGSAMAQTIYAGKRPNLIRIYDKLAEWRRQLRNIERSYRRFNTCMEGMDLTDEQKYYGRLIAPTFQEFCRAEGYEFNPGKILARVERQIGGKIPPEFATVGDLRYVHETKPFAGLEIVPSAPSGFLDSPVDGMSTRNWLAAAGFEWLKERLGSEQLARQMVVKHGKGNGKRILKSLAETYSLTGHPLTVEELHESFKASTLRQTSQQDVERVHLSPTYEDTKQIA